MRRRKSILSERRKEADIMITPLADVSFTILITLMVLTPVMIISSSLRVNLPEAATIEPPQEKNTSITITSENILSVNNRIVSRDEFPDVLREAIKSHPDRLIFIRADRSTKTDAVMRIITVAKKLGAKHISIATVQRQ
ncbi:biopolymer transporter ExbD [candidate division WOR-3 bacterium]|nr:biopolymer transporter ExbD [candidate division WOR-3 bacterium]